MHMCMCKCMCVCVCAPVRACVRACLGMCKCLCLCVEARSTSGVLLCHSLPYFLSQGLSLAAYQWANLVARSASPGELPISASKVLGSGTHDFSGEGCESELRSSCLCVRCLLLFGRDSASSTQNSAS